MMPPSAEQLIHAELRELRSQVRGVYGSMVATNDGFMVAEDLPDPEPTRIAAIVATTLGLARQAMRETGCGDFRESVTRGADGYLAVFTAGGRAAIAVLGTNELNVGMLHYQVRELAKRVTHHLDHSVQSRRFLTPEDF